MKKEHHRRGELAILLVILAALFALALSDAEAAGDYDLRLRLTQRGETLSVSGRVSGGVSCRNLVVDVWGRSTNGDLGHVEVPVGRYSAGGSKLVRGSDWFEFRSRRRGRWSVTRAYASCH